MAMRRSEPKKLAAEELYQYAVRALSSRALTRAEMRKKLEARAVQPGDVGNTLARLEEHGFLNDASFAENYATARRDSQGFGRLRVLRDLRTRRVSSQLASEAVETAFQDTDENTLIGQYLERKYRGKDLREYLADERHMASAFRRLRTAGFSAGASIRALKRYTSRAEELEGIDEAEPGANDATE